MNLLEPGDTPHENAQFLLFLVAVIKAVDEYQDLLRISIASAGNDHRLGAQEAPPAIVSMFLGDELTEILESIDAGTPMEGKEKTIMRVGVHAIPYFHRDTTDRNRTSPFAFTGNKFEFRMPGSSASISTPNVCLNSAVADVLRGFADELEGANDFESALHDLIRKEFHDHKRIVFNGNGYDEAWLKEAKNRGLSNYPSTVDALPHMLDEKNVTLYQSLKVLSLTEIQSRYEVALETYSKKINIEAKVMVDMARKQILPSVTEYQQFLAGTLNEKRACGMDLDTSYEEDTLSRIAAYTGDLFNKLRSLEESRTIWRRQSSTVPIFCGTWKICATSPIRWKDSSPTSTGPSPITRSCSSASENHIDSKKRSAGRQIFFCFETMIVSFGSLISWNRCRRRYPGPSASCRPGRLPR